MDRSIEMDWKHYVAGLRRNLCLSQEGLAAQLQTNHCTVSRWERGITIPNYRMRAKLIELHRNTHKRTAVDEDAITAATNRLFTILPTPSILLRIDELVVAASPDSKYEAGKTLTEQTATEELDRLEQFRTFLQETDFWNSPDTCFTFRFYSNGKERCNILTSTQIGGQ